MGLQMLDFNLVDFEVTLPPCGYSPEDVLFSKTKPKCFVLRSILPESLDGARKPLVLMCVNAHTCAHPPGTHMDVHTHTHLRELESSGFCLETWERDF